MSTRLSPDGMYYWDGEKWVSTLSPDGRYRWNGATWMPAPPVFVAAYEAPRTVREPTSWTRPMQYAVAAWYGLSALYSLTLPIFMGGMVSSIMNQSFQRQEQLNPNVAPPPPELMQSMTNLMTGVFWLSALFGIAIAALFIIGALKRWTWIFYVVLVLLGLGAVSGPLNLINIFNSSAYSSLVGYSFPTAFFVVGFLLWIPGTALFIWMLVAAVKRGPWAMRRVT